MDTTIALIIPILAFVVIGTRILFGKWDKSRIRKYIQQRGGQVTSIEWNPFATGWLYANHDRLYTVAFMDNAGKHYKADCRTSALTGVFFSEESTTLPVKTATQANSSKMTAEEENQHLRKELEDLRNKITNK
jgi:hypothetical protein